MRQEKAQLVIDEVNIFADSILGQSPIGFQEVERLKPFVHIVDPRKRVFNRRGLSFASLPTG